MGIIDTYLISIEVSREIVAHAQQLTSQI